jgi:hypothetical protein
MSSFYRALIALKICVDERTLMFFLHPDFHVKQPDTSDSTIDGTAAEFTCIYGFTLSWFIYGEEERHGG